MKYVKSNELKRGMRLAKPIYNRDGILLYERNSRLTEQGIVAVRNFGLIGIYILDMGEPLPPMTKDDIEFERFQSVTIFAIKDEINIITKRGKTAEINSIADSILKNYGTLDRKINFVQNLRSKEDYIAKHTLNVAILCAMMGAPLGWKEDRKKTLIHAALLHDVGKAEMPLKMVGMEDYMSGEENSTVAIYQEKSLALIERFYPTQPLIKWTAMQADRMLKEFYKNKSKNTDSVPEEAKVLAVAEFFDTMTAMKDVENPASDIAALKCLVEYGRFFGERIVRALISSINFLAEGCCVELSNGEEGLVLARNNADVLRPRILSFRTNQIIELDQDTERGIKKIEIRDAMKTLDNRYVIDWETAEAYFKSLEEQKKREDK